MFLYVFSEYDTGILISKIMLKLFSKELSSLPLIMSNNDLGFLKRYYLFISQKLYNIWIFNAGH